MAHGDNIVIIGTVFVAVYLFVPIATLASGFLRSRGDERTFLALVAANVALWVLFTTSTREDSLAWGLSFPHLCLVILTSVGGGVARFYRAPSGTKSSGTGSMLLGFAIGVPVPLTVLGRVGLFSHQPHAGVTVALVFLTGFLLYQASSGRSRMRLKQPFDTYGFTCFALAGTLGIATFLANFFPLQAAP
ncbi:MAG: hypothetical protein ACT6U0_20065 [Shinella sp.]|uniref:hypothetical protein n=1 Tax=Shinella sp. TaxID=1870904 RepID=UPI0040375224